MRGRRLAALLGSVLVVAAASPAPPTPDPSDYVFEAEITTTGPTTICVNDTERIMVSARGYQQNWYGGQVGHGIIMPVGLVVTLDGQPLFVGRASLTTIVHTFDQVGTFAFEVAVNPPLGWEAARTSGARVFLKVVECYYEIDTFSIWHLNDGGFNPVMSSSIDSARLDRVTGTLRSFEGTGTATNVAVAFPRGGCTPTFDVEDVQADLTASVTTDYREVRIHIEWKRGRAGMAGTGVKCSRVGGGTSDPFQIAPLDVRMPVNGVYTPNVQGVAHTMSTHGRTINGTTYLFVTRVRP